MSKKGWIVTLSGMGLNLALGVLYAWSVFGKQFTESIQNGGFEWTKTQASLPYTIAIAFFALIMVPAGRLQDKIGPRLVATIGALFTGIGLIITSFATPENIMPAIIGFGVFAGTGFGLGYAAATPAAVKWFPPEKKGLITGIVVSGFGLAPVYIAPLSKYLLSNFGISKSFLILGISFTIITTILCQFIKNPDKPLFIVKINGNGSTLKTDFNWKEMIKTPTFYFLWLEYAFAATAGLMIIGHLAKIVAVQSNNTIKIGFMFVALLAIFNAFGRIAAGIISDKIGRIKTIFLVCMSQAIVMFFFSSFNSITTFIIGSAIVGFSYGSCLSVFPSTTADFWGTKNLGMNYGIMFTAWGVGGVFGPLLAGKIADISGSYNSAYLISSALMILASAMTFLTKAPKKVYITAVEPIEVTRETQTN